MESELLSQIIEFVGSSGIILSSEEKACLQASLVILRNENKFYKVYFWGKIIGIKGTYFIAQGIGKNEFGEKRCFYSMDCTNWKLIPMTHKELREKCKLAKGRFTADPSFEYEHVEMKTKDGEGDASPEEVTIIIKEEDRLSATISDIDYDVKIVPRAAFIRTPTGEVVTNRSFEGLTIGESAKLNSYMHFREPVLLSEKHILVRAKLEKSIDFMDTIEEDIPKGSWSVQFERGSGFLTIRSLLWPGYIFYCVPGKPIYGGIYVGNGEMNRDLPFML